MKQLNALLQAQFDRMCATGKLFRSTLTGQEVWDMYLLGFGNDPVFRDPESSEHNCNLAVLIRGTKETLKKHEDAELNFLDETKVVDTITQLRFDILKDVYLSKKKESEEIRNAAEAKAHNQKIMGIIQSKKEGALQEMSVEELEKLLK